MRQLHLITVNRRISRSTTSGSGPHSKRNVSGTSGRDRHRLDYTVSTSTSPLSSAWSTSINTIWFRSVSDSPSIRRWSS